MVSTGKQREFVQELFKERRQAGRDGIDDSWSLLRIGPESFR